MSRGPPTTASPSKSPESDSKKPTRKQRRQQEREKIVVPALPSSGETTEDDDSITIITPSFGAFPISTITSMAIPLRLLVCSIGNPAPYTNTLHSAGHTVLTSLASSLGYPAFQKSKSYDGAVSIGSDFTLWQSRSLMNVSGRGVAAAWRQFQKESRGEPARLVVVHDELELPFGDVRVKDGSLSARGHNGLKDITQRLGGAKYMRVCVGIGRPESREPNVVAAYVLRKMSGSEMGKIVGAAGKVEMELRKLGGML